MKDPGFVADVLRISAPIGASGEREIRVGTAIAYGEVDASGETYSLAHAPTQQDFDSVAAILDAAGPEDMRYALARN